MVTTLIESFIKTILLSNGFKKYDVDKLIENYKIDFRKYHNLHHIADLIEYTNSHFSTLNSKEMKLLLLAIIFHNVIYEVGSNMNEIESAHFFLSAAEGSELSINEKYAIYNLILVTKNHIPYVYAYPEIDLHYLSMKMIQADLSGFEVHNFLYYERLVQAEFSSKYSWEEYKSGHLKFLETYKDRVSLEGKKNIDSLLKFIKKEKDYSF